MFFKPREKIICTLLPLLAVTFHFLSSYLVASGLTGWCLCVMLSVWSITSVMSTTARGTTRHPLKVAALWLTSRKSQVLPPKHPDWSLFLPGQLSPSVMMSNVVMTETRGPQIMFNSVSASARWSNSSEIYCRPDKPQAECWWCGTAHQPDYTWDTPSACQLAGILNSTLWPGLGVVKLMCSLSVHRSFKETGDYIGCFMFLCQTSHCHSAHHHRIVC